MMLSVEKGYGQYAEGKIKAGFTGFTVNEAGNPV
jgi:hypothetical protein